MPQTVGNQLATEDGPWASDTVTNTYNNRFRNALSLQQPTGTWTNGFGYDEFARLTNVISPAGTSSYQYRDITLASGDHTACELVARLNLPNTSYITNNHDGLGRLLSTFLNTSGDVTLNSHEYSYNNGSQRTHQTFSGGSYVDYYYDNISQLTNADSSANTEDRSYVYDAAWNLSSRTSNGVTRALSEPYTPTIATLLPRKIERCDGFSVTNASQNEAKITYVRLNSQNENGSVPHNRMSACKRLHY